MIKNEKKSFTSKYWFILEIFKNINITKNKFVTKRNI